MTQQPSILQHASPRPDLLKGELNDGIFAADFADVAAGKATPGYQDPAQFFSNTHPTAALKDIVKVVFGVLTDPNRVGGLIQLSTAFGGGKSHTLITLFHLAQLGPSSGLGEELIAPEHRPAQVSIVTVDGSRTGFPYYSEREGRAIRSLWGDVFYQLAGQKGLQILGEADHPEASPNEAQLDAALPPGPVLFLIDELVIYMSKLNDYGRKNLLSFINLLALKCNNRPQTVMVITDPAAQHAYAQEASDLTKKISEAQRESNVRSLTDILGRKSSEYDAIGDETAQVIIRRLFTQVDRQAAETASISYAKLYARVAEEKSAPLPTTAGQYAERLLDTWPLHPRLLDTVQDRLSTLPGFQRGRGVLRLFARILQSVYEKNQDLPCITAGDIDWAHPRVQAELLDHLRREGFKPAAHADVQGHAYDLDGDKRGIHTRVASALLLESLPADDKSGMNAAEVTLAVLRPSEGGMEPSEALDHLIAQCWHTYPMTAADGWQFRQQPNISKQIGERVATISQEDAKRRVLAEARTFFGTASSHDNLRFQVVAFPDEPHLVPSKTALQLAVCEDLDLARRVVEYEDTRDGHNKPRRYRNAVVAVAPTPDGFSNAVMRARYLIAAEAIERANSHSQDTHAQKTLEQVGVLRRDYSNHFQLQARRAFSQIVLPGGVIAPLEEKDLVTEDEVLQKKTSGQENIGLFLRRTARVYLPDDKLDADLLKSLLPGAVSNNDGSYTIEAVYNRLLGAARRLIDGRSIAHNSIRAAVEQGVLAIRFPDGSAYGLGSFVNGPPGARQASNSKPNLASMPTDSVVALIEHATAKAWLKTDEPQPVPQVDTPSTEGASRTTPPPPPPPPPGEASATDWEAVRRLAGTRPLKTITLTVTEIAASQGVQTLIGQVNPKNVTLTLNVEGTTTEGERARMEFKDMRLNHPLKPLDMARMLMRGLKTGDFKASFKLTFEPPAPAQISQTLAERSPTGTAPYALFGEETP